MRGNQSHPPPASAAIAIAGAGGSKVSDSAASGAQDTIYLCNFRVSVDGDWLCLKELAEEGAPSSNALGSPTEGGKCAINESATCLHTTPQYADEKYDKCNEKIVERDWVNYYCRCFISFSCLSLVFYVGGFWEKLKLLHHWWRHQMNFSSFNYLFIGS